MSPPRLDSFVIYKSKVVKQLMRQLVYQGVGPLPNIRHT